MRQSFRFMQLERNNSSGVGLIVCMGLILLFLKLFVVFLSYCQITIQLTSKHLLWTCGLLVQLQSPILWSSLRHMFPCFHTYLHPDTGQCLHRSKAFLSSLRRVSPARPNSLPHAVPKLPHVLSFEIGIYFKPAGSNYVARFLIPILLVRDSRIAW